MHLFFLRHGQAGSHQRDAMRPLTEAGIREVRACAEQAASYLKTVRRIYVSPLVRAQQTCQLVCDTAGLTAERETVEWLTPESSPREVVKQLLLEQDDVLLVSHQPLANALLAYLNDTSSPLAFIDTANLVALEGVTIASAAMRPVLRVDRNGLQRLN